MQSVKSFLRNFGIVRRVKNKFRPPYIRETDKFLLECRRILHVGANSGQERYMYESIGLEVIWIEAIPHVYDELVRNIKGFKGQVAINTLVADVSGKEIEFHISNNESQSSSIFKFEDHTKIWPDVKMTSSVKLTTGVLDSVISENCRIDAIVLDVQGAELLALKGAKRLLGQARFVKAEAADFNIYSGGCTVDSLSEFLEKNGFREIARYKFAYRDDVGNCYDVLYRSQILF